MRDYGLWLRWSWRDLRDRWLQVGAIALVIALGTGTFAGLSSTANWREVSSDRSYAELNMFDLRVESAQGTSVAEGALLAALDGMEDRDLVASAEERLVVPIQVDASVEGETILVPGQLIGVNLSQGGPNINRVHIVEGRQLTPEDAGAPVVLLEANFASHYNLPADGEIRTGGGRPLRYVGHAIAPEYFIVTTERGGMLAEANFAAVIASLETAQDLAGLDGMVNDLLLTVEATADPAEVRRQVEAALAAELPGQGFTFVPREDDRAYRIIYEDIEGDRRMQRIFALLILFGAAAAAFNLTTRIVDAQRREMGIAMALGVPRLRIAIRPLLVGTQVALLGVIFGLITGYIVGQMMASVVQDFFPLPIWDTAFQFRQFGTAAAIGFVLPFAATLVPVLMAVRLSPLDALRSGYRAAKGGGLAPLFRRLRMPGNTFAQMPVRNVVRAPRRALLTGLGIMAAITILVTFAGMIDSFGEAVNQGERELLRTSEDRIDVDLATLVAANGAEMAALEGLPPVERVEPALHLGGFVRKGDTEISVRLEVFDLTNAVWAPSVVRGDRELERPGLFLSEVAADDLGVGPGDVVVLRHPRLEGGTINLVETELPVLGLHPHPFRFVAYMHSAHADITGLEGAANFAWALPADGASEDDVRRALFDVD
ncbi:MAG TPA: FtsX-like permease family protein, partial [Tepidiformaceae bacterium]